MELLMVSNLRKRVSREERETYLQCSMAHYCWLYLGLRSITITTSLKM